MKKWQQLKVELTTTNSLTFRLNGNSREVVAEIEKVLGDGEPLQFGHIGWLGWELVAVCKTSFYYKRQLVQD